MSTIIKIILPVTSEEDIVSGFTDIEDIFTREQMPPRRTNSSDSLEQGNFNRGDANSGADVSSTLKNNPTNSKVCRPPRYTRQIHCVNNNQGQQSQENSKHYVESRQEDRDVSEQQQQQQKKLLLSESRQQRIKLSLSQTQHQISGDVWPRGHLVILDKNSGRARSSTPSSTKVEPPNTRQQTIGSSKNVRLSAAEAYDIDLEHRDMMMKALRFYTQYCRHEGSNHCIECNGSHKPGKKPYVGIPDFDNLCGSRPFNRESTLSSRSRRISRCVKMAQCRLRFYDDVDKVTHAYKSARTRSPPLPHNTGLLYALEDGDGVLADSMGHTYRSTQTRPWSVLPKTLGDICNGNYHSTCRNCDRRSQKTASVTRCNDSTRRQHRSDLHPSRQVSVVALTLRESMSQSIPRSVAYQRRNQTTHLWTDSSNLMSQSVPTATFLHRHFSSASSSPRSSLDDSGKASKARPSSSYSYDGGFFVGAHSGQAEYFVIHPDWVSEAMTVKKIPLGDKKTGSSLQRSISLSARLLPEGRRCLSAPPKQRNPITMEHAERESAEKKSQRK